MPNFPAIKKKRIVTLNVYAAQRLINYPSRVEGLTFFSLYAGLDKHRKKRLEFVFNSLSRSTTSLFFLFTSSDITPHICIGRGIWKPPSFQ